MPALLISRSSSSQADCHSSSAASDKDNAAALRALALLAKQNADALRELSESTEQQNVDPDVLSTIERVVARYNAPHLRPTEIGKGTVDAVAYSLRALLTYAEELDADPGPGGRRL